MSDLYDLDFIGWTEQQARLLRDAAARGVNLPLDWGNLAEEIESLGRSEYHSLVSQVTRLIEHLLKLEFSPSDAPRAGWLATIDDARADIDQRLELDPGLKPRLAEAMRIAATSATKRAVTALQRHGEADAAAQVRALGGARYTQAQLLGDWLPEQPRSP